MNTAHQRAGLSLVYIKLVCQFVGCDSMPLGLVDELNLLWMFRGFSMRLFLFAKKNWV